LWKRCGFPRGLRQPRAYAQCKDAGEFGHTPRVQSMRITIEGGVRVYRALAEWARWAAEYRLPGAGPEE
jgi:hypothetical protein